MHQSLGAIDMRGPDRGPLHLAPTCASQAQLTHQSLDGAPCHRHAFTIHRQQYPTGNAEAPVGVMDPIDALAQLSVRQRPGAGPV
jgi:hypothetical protein